MAVMEVPVDRVLLRILTDGGFRAELFLVAPVNVDRLHLLSIRRLHLTLPPVGVANALRGDSTVVSSRAVYEALDASRKAHSPGPKPSAIHSGNVRSRINCRRGAAFVSHAPIRATDDIVFAITGNRGCNPLSVQGVDIGAVMSYYCTTLPYILASKPKSYE